MERAMKINCIVLDLGGVLFENGTKNAISLLRTKYSLPLELLESVFYGEISFKLRAGKIKEKEYWNSVYDKYKELKAIDLKSIWYNSYAPNAEVCDLLMQLSKEYILGILSDNIQERVDFLKNVHDLFKYFSFEIYSYETGKCKIDKDGFKALDKKIKELNFPKREVLFVDDNQECVLAARNNGYNGMLYEKETCFSEQMLKLGITAKG